MTPRKGKGDTFWPVGGDSVVTSDGWDDGGGNEAALVIDGRSLERRAAGAGHGQRLDLLVLIRGEALAVRLHEPGMQLLVVDLVIAVREKLQ